MRIAIAGFQHETNTFATSRADMTEFETAVSWPALMSGDAVLEGTRGMNLPISGAAEAAGEAELVPILWCAAEPSGPVTDAAFESIAGRIVAETREAKADGLYLDLHGAMVTEAYADGEAELLRRLRGALGPDLPIAVSLDLHANISAALVEAATVITIYRSYLHLDMAETGARAMRHLKRAVAGQRYSASFRQAPFLVPLHAQCSHVDPARRLYDQVIGSDDGNARFQKLALGFTAADVPDCGPAILAYAPTANEAAQEADGLLQALVDADRDFDARLFDPDAAVALAQAEPGISILADVQDNPGAGGTSDTTGLLRALITGRATSAALGVLCDAKAAEKAHHAGEGATLDFELGGSWEGDRPLNTKAKVLRLSEGAVPCTGEVYRGTTAQLGPSALLHITEGGADVSVVLSSARMQCLDQAFFRHFGVVLEDYRTICIKSTVHYRADFEPLADRILNVAAPGVCPCRIDLRDYRRLRPGLTVAGTG